MSTTCYLSWTLVLHDILFWLIFMILQSIISTLCIINMSTLSPKGHFLLRSVFYYGKKVLKELRWKQVQPILLFWRCWYLIVTSLFFVLAKFFAFNLFYMVFLSLMIGTFVCAGNCFWNLILGRFFIVVFLQILL